MANNLEDFFNQIEKLELAEVPDDEYVYIPTKYAVDRTMYILSQLDSYMGVTLPGYVWLEGRGGIYIDWDIENLGCVIYRVGADVDIDDSVYWENDKTDDDNLWHNPTLSKVAELLDLLFWRENDVTLMDYEPKLIGGGDPHGMNHFERQELLKNQTYSKENK